MKWSGLRSINPTQLQISCFFELLGSITIKKHKIQLRIKHNITLEKCQTVFPSKHAKKCFS